MDREAWTVGAVVAVIILACVGLVWWAVSQHQDYCHHQEQIVLSIVHNDPADAKGALDLYAESCP